MIRNFSDHSANERTFLAWVRTAIAVMAFGFLGTAMVGIAAARFVMTAKNIDREDLRPGTGSRIDIALAGLLVLLGCALFLYLSHALVTKL
jgi:putative membrane protein